MAAGCEITVCKRFQTSKIKCIDHIICNCHNGPEMGAMKFAPYGNKYLETNQRCDPLHSKEIKKKKNEDEERNLDNEEDVSIFSTIFSNDT